MKLIKMKLVGFMLIWSWNSFGWSFNVGPIEVKGDDPKLPSVPSGAGLPIDPIFPIRPLVPVPIPNPVVTIKNGLSNGSQEVEKVIKHIIQQGGVTVSNVGREADIFLKNVSREVGSVYAANILTFVSVGRVNACIVSLCASEVYRNDQLREEKRHYQEIANQEINEAKRTAGTEKRQHLIKARDNEFAAYRNTIKLLENGRSLQRSQSILIESLKTQAMKREMMAEIESEFAKSIKDDTLAVAQFAKQKGDQLTTDDVVNTIGPQLNAIAISTGKEIAIIYSNFISNLDVRTLKKVISTLEKSSRSWKSAQSELEIDESALSAKIESLNFEIENL